MANYNKNSNPSKLKITDMRIAVVGHDNWRWPIIKIHIIEGSLEKAFMTQL